MASRKTVIKKIVVGRPIRTVDVASVGNASQLASNPPSYYLDYTNFTNTPNVLDSADVSLIAQANSTDSAQVAAIVDSAYINARLDDTQFLDSAEAIALIDSDYILARASNIQNLRDSGSDTIITGALLPAVDSAQNIGSPTKRFKDLYLSGSTLYIGNVAIGADSSGDVKIFSLDGNGAINSTRGKIALLDAADSDDDILGKVDSDYVSARVDRSLFLDSSEVIALVDSNYVAARTFTQSDIEAFARAVSLDSAETIGLIDSDYIKGFIDSSYVKAFARQVSLDSAETIALIDSAYVNARLDTTAFLDSAETISLIDSAYVAARTWTQAQIEQFASNILLDSAEAARLIDSAVNNVIDGAPGALDTLNELAAALNDDSNAFNTLNNLIATKLTAADFDTRFDSALGTKTTDNVTEGSTNLYYTDTRVSTLIDSAYITARASTFDSANALALIDSAYIQARASTFDSADAIALIDSDYIIARQAPGTDSAQVEAIAAALIDSDYVSARQSAGVLTLGNVTDGSLTDGAIQTLTSSTKIVDAIDELNEAMLNVSNNTFVRSVNFVGSPLAGGQGVSVTLNMSVEGQANRFDIDWGDGTIDSNRAGLNPSHTYNTNVGSPFTVSVRAFNPNGSGVGSEATLARTNYVVIYTADPVANYNVYAAPTGGSPITFWQDGDTVYFENTTTNTTMADVTYRWTWGDGSQDIIDSDGAAGGVTGPRIAHTFPVSTNTDVQRTTQLELTTHTTADPTVISGGVDTSDTFEIYDSYNVSYIVDALRKVNNSSTFTFTVENTGLTGVGSYSTYNNQIRHNFIGGAQTINAGSGASGDIGQSINKTYNLTSTQQTNGTSASFNNSADLISRHVNSPFSSNTLTVTVEPQLISSISLLADTVSDGSNDNNTTLYNFTDLLGRNRRAISATLDIENGSGANSINFAGDQTFNPIADNATQSHAASTWSIGTNTVTVSSTSTPDTISQSDTASATFTVKAVPTAPTKINTKALSISTSGSGTFPRLAYGYTSNGGQTNLTGFNLENSGGNGNSTRITTQNWQTNDLTDIDHQNGGFVGAFRYVNGGGQQGIGNVTTDTTLSQTGLYNQLRIVEQRDMHQADATIPSEFYKVYNLRVEGTPSNLNYGLNQITAKNNFGAPDGLIETSNRVNFVKDTGNVVTIESIGGIGEVSTAGRKYIGGVPYINSGSSSGLSFAGIQVRRLTTECYTNQINILEVDFDTNQEGSSGSVVSNTDYQYSDIVYSTEMQGSIPHAYIGQSSNYTLKTVNVPINSNIRSVGNLKIRARNANGISSYSAHTTPIRVYNASSITGIDETNITSSVPNKNGNGVRVSGFAAVAGDTPSYTGSNNFYTGYAMNHTTDFVFEGKKEAGVSVNGLIQHDVTNYSGHLPSGPNRSGDTGNQYFTFAFRSTALQNFNIDLTSSTGITGLYIALPGTGIDTSSTLNGWLDCTAVYNGSGQPGAGTGGNGSNGCAFSGEAVPTGSAINNQSYSMTFGTLSAAGSTGNNILVRLVLASGETVSNIGVSQFS